MNATAERTDPSAAEVLLLGLKGDRQVQLAVITLCREFGAHIVARNPTALIVQHCGSVESGDQFISRLPAGCITQTCRSPVPADAAICRAPEASHHERGNSQRSAPDS